MTVTTTTVSEKSCYLGFCTRDQTTYSVRSHFVTAMCEHIERPVLM